MLTKNASEFGIKFIHFKFDLQKTLETNSQAIEHLDLFESDALRIADLGVFR